MACSPKRRLHGRAPLPAGWIRPVVLTAAVLLSSIPTAGSAGFAGKDVESLDVIRRVKRIGGHAGISLLDVHTGEMIMNGNHTFRVVGVAHSGKSATRAKVEKRLDRKRRKRRLSGEAPRMGMDGSGINSQIFVPALDGADFPAEAWPGQYSTWPSEVDVAAAKAPRDRDAEESSGSIEEGQGEPKLTTRDISRLQVLLDRAGMDPDVRRTLFQYEVPSGAQDSKSKGARRPHSMPEMKQTGGLEQPTRISASSAGDSAMQTYTALQEAATILEKGWAHQRRKSEGGHDRVVADEEQDSAVDSMELDDALQAAREAREEGQLSGDESDAQASRDIDTGAQVRRGADSEQDDTAVDPEALARWRRGEPQPEPGEEYWEGSKVAWDRVPFSKDAAAVSEEESAGARAPAWVDLRKEIEAPRSRDLGAPEDDLAFRERVGMHPDEYARLRYHARGAALRQKWGLTPGTSLGVLDAWMHPAFRRLSDAALAPTPSGGPAP